MGLFKKGNDNFFELLESDVLNEYSVKNKPYKTINAPDALTVDELSGDLSDTQSSFFSSEGMNPLETLKLRMKGISKDEKQEKAVAPKENADSLLERCKPYTTDDYGKNLSVSDKKLYKLESVAEILKSDSERAIEQLSKKYDVSVEDLKKVNIIPDAELYETKQPNIGRDIIFTDIEQESENYSDILNMPNSNLGIPDISDIDTIQKHEVTDTVSTDTATIRFTPVNEPDGGNRISVSSFTKTIDISADLKGMYYDSESTPNHTELEETEFEEFSAKEEFTDMESGKMLIRKLSIRKRNRFLSLIFSFISLFITSLFSFTTLGDFLITKPKMTLIFCGVLLLINIIGNITMFAGLKNLFSHRCNADTLTVLVCVAVAILTLLQISQGLIGYSSNTYYIIFACSIILFARALNSFWQISSKLGNLKQIATPRPKKAVDLITDSATTFAMAKNFIESDILVATPRNTEFVSGFMKYSEFGNMLGGKMSLITLFSLLMAIILGISSGVYRSSTVGGFYSAAAMLCIAALPSLFFIDILPLYGAAKRLNKKGAMIAGKTAAEKLELANAAVISTTDIFPDGMVALQHIKVLSENNIDDTIIRAAALTEAVGSPLTPIFKQIAKTNNSYAIPDSDDVKYEERLGLSGWIGDVMLFVGNRTLLESHGIDVPDIEVDKKILRNGFFPVYIACGGKACALVVIRYAVDSQVAHELRKITDLGVTLLVNNHDPNINEEMLCDYFGLYNDSVKIMSNAGVHMYKNAVVPANSCIAPAAFRSSALTFISIMNCASKIKKSNSYLCVLYVLCAVLGISALAYMTFSGTDSAPAGLLVLLYSLISTAISAAGYLINKP